jgi:hypothetical protein
MLHRVALLQHGVIITRGDARLRNDAPVAREEIVARAVAVRRDGIVTPLRLTMRFGLTALARYLIADAKRGARRIRAALRRGLRRGS